jgi:hypothetical protein
VGANGGLFNKVFVSNVLREDFDSTPHVRNGRKQARIFRTAGTLCRPFPHRIGGCGTLSNEAVTRIG